MTFDEMRNAIQPYVDISNKKRKQFKDRDKLKKRKILTLESKDPDDEDDEKESQPDKKKFKKPFSKNNFKCYNCGKFGHYAQNCKNAPMTKKSTGKPIKKKKYTIKNLRKQMHCLLKKTEESKDFQEDSSDESESDPVFTKKKVKISVITMKRRGPVLINILKPKILKKFEEGFNPDVIFDSGAQATAFSKVHPLMSKINENPRFELQFGGGEVAKVDALGDIGMLKNIHCSTALTHECLSIPQLACMGFQVVFDSENAYVMKREANINIKKKHILMTAKMIDGLYKMPMNDLVTALIAGVN